jgi:hypothetical protein
VEPSPVDWRSLFVRGIPPITPHEAYGAVLLYPEDDREIDELAAQPFVADYIQDLAEQDRGIGKALMQANRVYIENGDAVIATCVPFDRPRDYTVLVRVPAFAQKQAQQLWTVCAELQRWDWLSRIRFLPVESLHPGQQEPTGSHDLAYSWIPYPVWEDRGLLATFVDRVGRIIRRGGQAFIVGPGSVRQLWSAHGFHVSWEGLVEELPTFRMHRSILPTARLRAGLTLYHVVKL